MYNEGDIVEIPLPDGRNAVGMILHVSERTKNAVGFIVFGIKGHKGTKGEYIAGSNTAKAMDALGVLYTNIALLKKCGWTVVAHQPLSDRLRGLTRREVGGNVYVGDTYLGTVEQLNQVGLPRMLLYGMPAVYGEIEKAFGTATPK